MYFDNTINKDLEKQIQLRLVAAKAERTMAMERFNALLSQNVIIDKFYPELAAKNAAKELSSILSIMKIIGYGAKDMLPRQSGNLENYISPVIDSSVDKVMMQNQGLIELAKKQLDDDLDSSNANLSSSLMQIVSSVADKYGRNVKACTLQQRIANSARELNKRNAAITGYRAATIVTPSIIKLAAKKFGPQITRAKNLLPSPLLDGPLPFGDVIAAIGGLFTVGELIWSANEFEKEVFNSINQALGSYQDGLIQDAKAYSVERSDAFERKSNQLAQDALQIITNTGQI